MSGITNLIRRNFNVYGIEEYAKIYAMDSIGNNIKTRYGEEIYFKGYEKNKIVSDWIAKYDSKFSNRNKDNGCLVNCQFIFKLDTKTFCYVQVGDYIDKFDILSAYTRQSEENGEYNISLYIFGKKYRKYAKELKDTVSHSNTTDLYIYNIKGESKNGKDTGIDSVGRVMNRRDLDTLFYNDHVKNTITDHIQNFFDNKHIYESKNLIYKTGILVYGAPGTGKSSLAVALASEYNYNLIVIDMTTFDKLDITLLTSCINCDTDKFIILLEDIDTLFNTLDREDNSIDKDDKAVINKMLQFLDSSSSPSDVIFLATTNHVDKLDKALLRDGRFDLKVEIGNIEPSVAREMVKSFGIEDVEVIDKIVEKAKDGDLINPATLQNKILEHFKEELKSNEE